MILSVSRRTDIPAYFSDWFFYRLIEEYCIVPNPFNPNQLSVVNLTPGAIDAIVFWTRNPRNMMSKLKEIDSRGISYYFQFSLTGYQKQFESSNPSFISSTQAFMSLSDKIGPSKVIWRYDPIIISDLMDAKFHIQNFHNIAKILQNYTQRVVISLVDEYHSAKQNLKGLQIDISPVSEQALLILQEIKSISEFYKLDLQGCTEPNLIEHGLKPTKCIDDKFLADEFGSRIRYKKDPGQRDACLCTISKDIGINNTCMMGCKYCYATKSQHLAIQNFRDHDPKFPMLLKKKIPVEVWAKLQIDIQRIKNRNEEPTLF